MSEDNDNDSEVFSLITIVDYCFFHDEFIKLLH